MERTMPTPNADGPDLSHWNALTGEPFPPEWQVVSLKCSEGERSGDSTFAERWAMLRAAEVKYRGAYHWLRSDSPVSRQAANLIERIEAVGGLQAGEFVQCDWETTPGISYVTVGMVEAWCKQVNTHFGRDCVIVYASDWVPGFDAWRRRNPEFPLWYANYNTGDRSNGGWAESVKYDADLWQWTSKFLHPTIHGWFDMNHVFNWSVLDVITAQSVPPTPPTPPGDDTMAEFAKVDRDDTAMLVITATTARWLPTMDAVADAETVCANDWRHPRILTETDCRARFWQGQQPHYDATSTAGPVRCQANMFSRQE